MRIRFALLALITIPLALALSPTSLTVTAVVGPDGVASVREDYLFVFQDANEMESFLASAEQLGNSFQLWIARFPDVDFHFGNSYSDLSDIKIYWGKVGSNAVKLAVRYSVRVASVAEESATQRVFVLNRFHLPRQSGAIVIPSGTSVVVILPQNARIISYAPAVDEAHRSQNIISWEGPITTNDIFVRYAVPKPAKPPSIVEFLSSTSTNIYLSLALLLVALAIFFRREQIGRWVQRYVEDNSDFEK